MRHCTMFPDPSILKDYWKKNKGKNRVVQEPSSSKPAIRRGPGRPPKTTTDVKISDNAGKKRISPRTKNVKFATNINYISFLVLLFFLPISLSVKDTLIDDFYFCEEVGENFASIPFLDLSGPCKFDNNTKKSFIWQELPETMSKGINILTKLPHSINGVGHECSVEVIEQKCSMSF
jgi:hypothetical protein